MEKRSLLEQTWQVAHVSNYQSELLEGDVTCKSIATKLLIWLTLWAFSFSSFFGALQALAKWPYLPQLKHLSIFLNSSFCTFKFFGFWFFLLNFFFFNFFGLESHMLAGTFCFPSSLFFCSSSDLVLNLNEPLQVGQRHLLIPSTNVNGEWYPWGRKLVDNGVGDECVAKVDLLIL